MSKKISILKGNHLIILRLLKIYKNNKMKNNNRILIGNLIVLINYKWETSNVKIPIKI